jgi:hypothetical protein
VSNRVRLDVGFRLDLESDTGAFAAPRAGVTWAVTDRVTVSAGAGWFASDVPLAPLAFGGYQSRRVTSFDEQGSPDGDPVVWHNVVSSDLHRARARISSARLDWRLADRWLLRVGAHERHGTRETIVSPLVLDGGATALLSSTGESENRSLETTLGYRTSSGHQFYVSYVRAEGRGNTNDFGQIEGLYRDPRLAPPEMAALPADVPHRLLAWGTFSLPARITVAPFLDFRSGFPYSAVADDWSYSGPRMAQRFPPFASLDVVVTKVVALPGRLQARLGIKLYNLTGRDNGREVQANATRPDFGRTYNWLGRQVRGVFEIIWNGNRK